MARTFVGNIYIGRYDNPAVTTTPFTVAGWFKGGHSLGGTIFSLADNTTGNNTFTLIATPGFACVANAQATLASSEGAQSSITSTPDVWQHACGVWTSATSRTAYCNGGGKVTDATNVAPTGISFTTVGGVWANDDVAGKFVGDLAEIAVWNVALSDAEILALARGVSPLRTRIASLVVYYPMLRHIGDVAPFETNYVKNTTDRSLDDKGIALGAPPTATGGHPPIAPPLISVGGWRSARTSSITFNAISFASSALAVGQPLAKDKHKDTVFTTSLPASAAGWQGRTLRQRIEAGMLSAVDPGFIRVTFQIDAGSSGQIDAAYIGHAAPSGDLYDFDGGQVRLTFNGANTRTLSGVETVQSDGATFAYDPTKPLIISAAFSGSQVNLRAY